MTTLKHVAKHIRTKEASWDTLTDIWCDNDRIKRFVGIVHAYALGTPVSKIQNEFQCSRSLVLQYARLAGLPKRQDEIAHLRTSHARLLEALRGMVKVSRYCCSANEAMAIFNEAKAAIATAEGGRE